MSAGVVRLGPYVPTGVSRVSLADSAARGGAATLGGQLIRFALQLATTAVLARVIAPSDFGLFAMVIAIVGIASVLGDFGLSMASIQSQTITDRQRSNLFWTNIAIGAVLSGAVYLSAPLVALFYGRPELVPISQALSVTFLLNAAAAQFRAEVSVKLRFKWLAMADVLAVFTAMLLAVTLGALGYGYWALVAQQLAISAVTLVVLVVAARWFPGLPSRGAGMRDLYKFGANTLGIQVVTYLSSNIDDILVGRFSGATAAGIYSRAYQLFRLPLNQIAAPMTRVALPILSKLQDDPRYDAYVARATLVLGYAFGGAFFMLAAFTDPVIDIMLGDGWEDAKPIFAVLAVGGVFQGLGFIYYWVFLSRALTGLHLKWSVIGRVAMIAMMCVGVLWGPLGVAIAASVGRIFVWGLTTAFPMRKSGVKRLPLLRIAMRPVLLFAPVSVAALALSFTVMTSWPVWIELPALLVFVAAYLACVYALSRRVRDDVEDLRDVLVRIRRRR